MNINITYNEWKDISYDEKIRLIQSVINIWKQEGKNVKYDVTWFFEAVEASMIEEDNTKLFDKMNLFALIGNAFGQRDELIKKLLSKITTEEFEIYKYVEDRFNYYDTNEGHYSGDKYFNKSINDGAKKFHLSDEEVKNAWDKVDKAKYGVE